MTFRCLFTAIAMLAIPSVATASSPQLNKQALGLAWRSIAISGGVYELVQERAFVIAWHDGATPVAVARLVAARKVIARHRKDLQALDSRLVANMADNTSVAALKVLVHFLESPEGRSIMKKTHAIFDGIPTPKVAQPSLTRDERAALSAFERTPEAHELKLKAGDDDLAFAADLLKTINRETDAICHDTKTCLQRARARP